MYSTGGVFAKRELQRQLHDDKGIMQIFKVSHPTQGMGYHQAYTACLNRGGVTHVFRP
jgi:hypothetical protein